MQTLLIPSTKTTVITIAEWGDDTQISKGDLVLVDGELEVVASLYFHDHDLSGELVIESAPDIVINVLRHDKTAVIRYIVED